MDIVFERIRIRNIIVEVLSENIQSIDFHKKRGSSIGILFKDIIILYVNKSEVTIIIDNFTFVKFTLIYKIYKKFKTVEICTL